jgi:DNA-binding CsgD family transcriptional regulator
MGNDQDHREAAPPASDCVSLANEPAVAPGGLKMLVNGVTVTPMRLALVDLQNFKREGRRSTAMLAASSLPAQVLTPRQDQIRMLLRRGLSNKMIAAELGISEGTVKNHISEIFRVLKTSNRTQAAQTEVSRFARTAPHSRELTNVMYDLDEYLHLALHANAKRDPHACIGYLKEALRADRDNAKAVYLLAIQHAEIGLIDRGIAGLTKVLALEPSFEIARLQLGLLMLDRGRKAEARDHFAASMSSADRALRAFAEGMILVVDEQVNAASEKMKSGLEAPTSNTALRALMQDVLTRIERMKSAAPTGDERIFMGAYEEPKTAR